MKYVLSLCVVLLSLTACHSKESKEVKKEEHHNNKQYTKFDGDYSKHFSDLPDLHLMAAEAKGIEPMSCRKDTSLCLNKLDRIPPELELYKTDTLKYSIPFLIHDATSLLLEICTNFRDSLTSKKMTLYKPILTSIMRTDEDVKILTKRNSNASDNSAHRYGTTFDISWRRFNKVAQTANDVSPEKLKLVLGQVLYDLRERDKCYIKYERKQACFHITVR